MKNTDFYFCHELTISVFAKDLKNHIINFLHHDQPICEDNLGIDAYVQILDDNYLKIVKFAITITSSLYAQDLSKL